MKMLNQDLLVCQYDYVKKKLTRKPFGNVNQFMAQYSRVKNAVKSYIIVVNKKEEMSHA